MYLHNDDVFRALHEQRTRELRDENLARGLLRKQRTVRKDRRWFGAPAAVSTRPRAA